jgi:hypothetical protein
MSNLQTFLDVTSTVVSDIGCPLVPVELSAAVHRYLRDPEQGTQFRCGGSLLWLPSGGFEKAARLGALPAG